MPTAGSNVVVVTGSNSLWLVRSTLRLGVGVGNELIISDGGRVDSVSSVVIGDDATVDPTLGKNRVLVTGSNSVLNAGATTNSITYIGRSSALNELIITNGAPVHSFRVIMGDRCR